MTHDWERAEAELLRKKLEFLLVLAEGQQLVEIEALVRSVDVVIRSLQPPN